MRASLVSFKSQQKGYILALNLAVLSLMLLGASFVGQKVIDAVQMAKQEQQSVDIAYEIESARARALMLLATTPRFVGGIGSAQRHVRLDGRTYWLNDTVLIQLQDVRGLISLNGTGLGDSGRVRIERLIRTFGVSDIKATELTDKLLDYRDADSLRHLNGAEMDEYQTTGKADEMRNGDLLSVNELPRVFGWRATTELWGTDAITNHISVQRGSTFNPNTASWRALVAMADIQPEMAKSLVSGRERDGIADMSSLIYGDGVGDPFGALSFVLPFPGPTLLVTMRAPKSRWEYRMLVTQTPGENTAPWRISAVWREPAPPLAASPADISKLPAHEELR